MGADKPGLLVGGATLLGSVAAAARGAGAAQVIVVGPARAGERGAGPDGPLRRVQEDPPAAGPVPALRRGLAEVTAPVVALLAADLPFLQAGHLRVLRAALAGSAPPAAPGAVALDDAGQPQWLASCWDTAALRRMAGSYRGSSLRGMLGPARPAGVRLDRAAGEPPPWLDCDTPEQLSRARAWREREVPR
jgi:molybdopterin-guanine dinucleotide biosynthesis protein A